MLAPSESIARFKSIRILMNLLARAPSPQQIKEKRRQAQQKAIDVRFDDHERFVNEVMTIEPAPYLKVVAVLHREA